MNTQITYTAYLKDESGDEVEVELNVEAQVESGGSDYHGSDEPSWKSIEDWSITHLDGTELTDEQLQEIDGDQIEQEIYEAA